MNGTAVRWFAFLESNTTGTGREFCARARARGLRPVLLTRDAARYPYVTEDAVDTLELDTSDLDAVVSACRGLAEGAGLAGITSSSEYFVADAARAAARLGLPAADGDAIARCRSKDLQRAALAAHGVPVPAWTAVSDVAAAVRAADAVGHPVVLKPVSGSGSSGVRLCRDRAETEEWARVLFERATDERGNAVPARVLVEAAVDGPEFSVETFDGDVVTVVAKHTAPAPHFVETGHDIPAPLDAGASAELGDTALAALKALGLGWGAAHTEIRRSADGPVVIEVNPRLAGGMIPVAVRAATGTDLVDAVIARAAGLDTPPGVSVPEAGAGHAAVRFVIAAGEGRVKAVTGIREAGAAPGVVVAVPTAVVGRQVRITHSFQDRLGCVVATGSGTAQAATRAEQAAGLIGIELEEPATPEKGNGGR
ncbi:ATP-grasp domain-containing protein [Streptomyces olivaceus]|uniref:ATP-grasp domain-containing protein n=1 Tax=Streptomyces olivaceus TaxID=47716 RepID=UPI0004C7D3A4|nr:ATP-grasp domain-containing protein [Streptomyces olivaceus]MBZ6100816.1 ATP-grasp domain-containing protein [Streptomyces olivaceus]